MASLLKAPLRDEALGPGASSSSDPPPLRLRLVSAHFVIPALAFLSGLSNTIGGTAYRLMLIEDARLEPQMQAIIGVAAVLPWDFKILAAFLSDWLPVYGKRRLPYLVLGIFVQIIEKALLGTLAPTVGWLLTDAFLASGAQVFIGVTLDSLAVSYTCVESPEDLGTMQTNYWAGLHAGNLLGGVGGSLLMDYFGVARRSIFYTAAALKLFMLAASSCVDDPPVANAESGDGTCSAMGARARSLLGELADAMRRRRVWMPALFIWIWMAHPGVGDSFHSFLLQQPNATYPNELGPQPLGFTPTQFSIPGLVGTLGSFIGTLAFKRYLRGLLLRPLFATLIIAGACISALQIVLALGLISDNNFAVFFAAGDSLVLGSVSSMLMMPILILIGSICPAGAMSSTYALITSIQCSGEDLSAVLTAGLTRALGLRLSDYSNLAVLIATCCALQLAFGLPFLWLVPPRLTTADGDPADATDSGSSSSSRAVNEPESVAASAKASGKEKATAPSESTPLQAAAAPPPASDEGPFGVYLLSALFIGSLSVGIGTIIHQTREYSVVQLPDAREGQVTAVSSLAYPPRHIALGPDATAAERWAATDLRNHIMMACPGVNISIGPPLVASRARAQFALGPSAATALGLPRASLSALSGEAALVDTTSVAGVVALTGGNHSRRGAVYAAHRYLELLGFRFLHADETIIPAHGCPTTVESIRRTFIPAFQYRDSNSRTTVRHPDWAVRAGFNGASVNISASRGGHISYAQDFFVHTAYALLRYPLVETGAERNLPPADVYEQHIEWFWPRNASGRTEGQLCWSNASLVAHLVEQSRAVLQAQPRASILSISQMDNALQCQSADERAINSEEDSPIGAMLRAVNTIAEALEDEFPHVIFDTLAYQWSQRAPKLTAPRANVVVRLCTINMDFGRPMAHPHNQEFDRDLGLWSSLTTNLHIWDYTANFQDYLTPFPYWHALSSNYARLAAHGAYGVFAEGVWNSGGGDLVQLRDYLVAKLLQDPTGGGEGGVDRLIGDFLSGYYGTRAAPHMRSYIDAVSNGAQRNESSFVGEAFGVEATWLTPHLVLSAACTMAAAERATTMPAAVGAHSRYVPRVEEASLPIMYVALRRWDEIRTYHGAAAREQFCDWPYAPSLVQQYEIFRARFERLGADGEPMRLGEVDPAPDHPRNMIWMHHILFDSSPSAPPPRPPAPPAPPPAPPVLPRVSPSSPYAVIVK